MPRSEGQKLKLLYLKQIFEEYSDENHGLTMEQILAHLSHNGVTAERKSIYMDIAVLTDEYGMDIELDKAAKPPVYKLMSRDFELPELKMMVDSIASSKFLFVNESRLTENFSTLKIEPANGHKADGHNRFAKCSFER